MLASGAPIFRLPPAADVQVVAEWLAHSSVSGVLLGAVIDRASAELGGEVGAESVKGALLCMSSAGLFLREPEGGKLSEQNFTLRPDLASGSMIYSELRRATQEKIERVLGSIEGTVFNRLLPDADIPTGRNGGDDAR